MKILKRLIALINKPRFINPEFSCPAIMVEVEPDGCDVWTGLGITEKRAKELIKIGHQLVRDHNSIHIMMVELSRHCKHPNELGFACYMLCMEVDKMLREHKSLIKK